MAEKIISGDSLQNEFVAKFNDMADEVNELKESGGSVEVTKEAITDALGYTPSEPVSVIHKYTTGRNLADIKVGNLHYGIYSPYAECIEDVLELPTSVQKIDDSKIYRITKVQSLVGGVKNQMPNPSTHLPDMLSGIPITIHHVETLPEAPEYATDDYNAPTKMVFYYLVSGDPLFETNDNRLYAYMPVGKLPATGEEDMANTWQRADTFLTGGYMFTDYFITSEDEIKYTAHNNIYFLADIELYHYRNGWQKVSKGATEKRVSEMIEEAVADIPSGGGSSAGDAIIDVESLPTEGINKNAIYRTKEVVCYTVFNGVANNLGKPVNIITVDTLPATGEPVLDSPTNYTRIIGYYQKSDNNCYCWATTSLGVPMDMWITLEQMLGMQGIPYGGIITSLEEVQSEEAVYVLKMELPRLYMYENGWKATTGITKTFEFTMGHIIPDSDSTDGKYTLSKLGENSAKQCTELFGLLRSMYGKIASIQYKSLIGSIAGVGSISLPVCLMAKSGMWFLDVKIDPFFNPSNIGAIGIALDETGRIIFDTDDINTLALAEFQIVVTIY